MSSKNALYYLNQLSTKEGKVNNEFIVEEDWNVFLSNLWSKAELPTTWRWKDYKISLERHLLVRAYNFIEYGDKELLNKILSSSPLQFKRGGIDLTDRMLNMRIERVGSFASSALALPEIANVEALDLDKEYERIQAMVSSSIRPSDTRILEFAAACYYRGEFDQRLAQVSSCVKAAHLADEISGRDSSEALRLATMLPDALYGG